MAHDGDRKSSRPSRIGILWRGQAPLGEAFWWYAIALGTLFNVLATFLYLGLHALGLPDAVGLVAFLLPVPYNLFVTVAVWRSAVRYVGAPIHAHLARVAVTVWAIAASLT